MLHCIQSKRGEKVNTTKESDDIFNKQNVIRQEIIKQYIRYRKTRNLTQTDLACAMGIKRPNISRFETGQCNPTLDLLVKMAECMDLEIKIELVDKSKEKGDEKKY